MGKFGHPFEVGQETEARSLIRGFRGAWFRCKITDIALRKKEITNALEYFDFPDEKVVYTKLYQKPVGGPRSRERKRQIMVRPSFPRIFHESQKPDVNSITEVVVIVNDVWKVGDLVDWLSDGCFWSATITEILGDGKARIELPPPPVGEGESYEVLLKYLRPTLEWSPEDGWTVPTSERENSCARIIKPLNPMNQEISKNLMAPPVEVTENAQPTAGPSVENDASFSSRMSTSSLPSREKSERRAKRPLSPAAFKETHALEVNVDFDVEDPGVGKSSYSDSVSSSQIRDAKNEMPGTDAGNKSCVNSGASKKMRADGSIPLNSSFSDTIEAAILDYEELVNRVKWIKGILQSGNIQSNTVRPAWKFLEHRSSKRKD